MLEPFLIGRRVYLRLFSEDTDGPMLLRWWNHPASRQHMPSLAWPAIDLSDLPLVDRRTSLPLGIVLLDGNLLVGLAALGQLQPFQRRAELFVLVQPEWQRRRIAQESCELLIQHAFDRLGLDLLSARLDEGHEAGRRLASRLGFEEIATLPQWNLRDGRRTAELVLALSRARLDQLRSGKQNPWSN
jgi:RimJ/RimL family protein N-acetyltransferase